MKSYDFVQETFDYSLFTLDRDDTRLHVLVYVDDLIITGTSVNIFNDFKHYLSSCFHMKDLGILWYFLGIEVARMPWKLKQKLVLWDSNPILFLLDQHHKLSLSKNGNFPDPTRYRRLVGRLIYLGNTQPELSDVIHILSHFMNAPQHAHWNAALRVVCYLKNSLFLRANTPLTLRLGVIQTMGRVLLPVGLLRVGSFNSEALPYLGKLINTMSYLAPQLKLNRAMVDTISKLLWLYQLLPTLGIKVTIPITLHSNNLSAIMLQQIRCFMLERNMFVEIFISSLTNHSRCHQN